VRPVGELIPVRTSDPAVVEVDVDEVAITTADERHHVGTERVVRRL